MGRQEVTHPTKHPRIPNGLARPSVTQPNMQVGRHVGSGAPSALGASSARAAYAAGSTDNPNASTHSIIPFLLMTFSH